MMQNLTQDNRQKYSRVIMDSLDDYSYRSKRYHIDFSLAIGLCNVNVDFNDLISKKRKTDKLIMLEENLCCVVLDCAPADCAVKATSNLQNGFKIKYSNNELYTGVVTSRDYDSDKNMVESLFDVLDYSITHDMKGLIADKNHMGHSQEIK